MTDRNPAYNERRVMMFGTFGFRPKATMSARALGIARALVARGGSAAITTVPWDHPADSGRRETVDGVPLFNTRTVRPALWPLAIAEMIREAERFSPDVVHVFKPKGFGDLAGRLLHRRRLPVVIDMDDWEGYRGWNDLLPYRRSARALFDWQERSWPARAGAVTVASRTLQQRALELGASPENVFYVPNGLSAERFSELSSPRENDIPDVPLLDGSDAFNVLLYTRFVEFDAEFVVRVLSRLSEKVPHARLVAAGGSADGIAEHRLIASAHRSGVADRALILGWINPGHLGHIAARCDAALVPFDDTLVNRAKCSVKLLELMACGIPIVASNVGENREYLGGGRYGTLARPADVESHAAGLSQVSRLSGGGRARTPSGPARVAGAYLWDDLAGTVLTAYRQAFCPPARPSVRGEQSR